MPGRTPHEALEAFLDPLRAAMACIGGAQLTLSPKPRTVGETHMWSLNGGTPVGIGGGIFLDAQMHFEIQDLGRSADGGRYKVSTSSYLYAIMKDPSSELVSAHWHPSGKSHHVRPHWHMNSAVLGPDGVFLERAPIPSPRVSFEYMIRWAIENVPGVDPTLPDWSDRLAASEAIFDEHKSWGR